MTREVVDHIVKRMPIPDERLGTFVYSIVLVQQGARITAYQGGGTDPRWVMMNGARLAIDEARIHFAWVSDEVLRRRGWTYATDA